MKKIYIILFLLAFKLVAICNPADSLNTKFKFAFNIGDSEWSKYELARDRIKALQIPQTVLKELNTKELLELCFEFPYIGDVLACNDPNKGIQLLAEEFNGLKELLKRKDLSFVLIDAFSKMLNDPSLIVKNESANRLPFSIRIYLTAHLIGEEGVYKTISLKQRESLYSLIAKKRDYILSNKNTYGLLGTKAIDFLLNIVSDSKLSNRANQYTLRYTPNGSAVPALIIPDDMTQSEKEYLKNSAINCYGAVFLSEATPSYNCHAYAWHMVEGNANDKVWINDEDIYWEDSSYIQVQESVATKVSYQNNHSAVRLNSNEYISKWGEWPLVKHNPANVPSIYGNPVRYYVRFNPVLEGQTLFNEAMACRALNLNQIFNVTWSINNPAFTLTSSGAECTVTYNQGHQYDEAILTASILYNGTIVKTMGKHITHIGIIEGKDLICNSEVYNTVTLPDSLSVTWSINNNSFSLNPSGNSCTVSCSTNTLSQEACLSATISGNAGVIATLTKDIFTHGTTLSISGIQETYSSANGYYPEQSISYNETNAGSGYTSSLISLNTDCDIYLESERFRGMEVSFDGDYMPTNVEHNGSIISFHTQPYSYRFIQPLGLGDNLGPFKPASYPLTMQLRDEEGCSDFDLNFIVRTLPYLNDSELLVSTTSTTLYVHLLTASPIPVGGGLSQQPTWYLSVINSQTGQVVAAKTVTGASTSVNISSFSSGIYIVRAVHDGNTYTAKFIK